MTAFKPSRDPKPDLKATATEAHHIWAHPGPDTIRHRTSIPGTLRRTVLQRRQVRSARGLPILQMA
jgi:hypothetical protein